MNESGSERELILNRFSTGSESLSMVLNEKTLGQIDWCLYITQFIIWNGIVIGVKFL